MRRCTVCPAGNVRLQVTNAISSVPKKRLNTSAAATPSTACAEWWSGIGGVVTSGVQSGSPTVAGLPSTSPCWIAVTGRQKS